MSEVKRFTSSLILSVFSRNSQDKRKANISRPPVTWAKNERHRGQAGSSCAYLTHVNALQVATNDKAFFVEDDKYSLVRCVIFWRVRWRKKDERSSFLSFASAQRDKSICLRFSKAKERSSWVSRTVRCAFFLEPSVRKSSVVRKIRENIRRPRWFTFFFSFSQATNRPETSNYSCSSSKYDSLDHLSRWLVHPDPRNLLTPTRFSTNIANLLAILAYVSTNI